MTTKQQPKRNRVAVPASAVPPTCAAAPQAGTDWDKVASLRPALPDIPDSAFSTREYAKKFSLSVGMAIAELEKALKAGKVRTAMSTGSRRSGTAGHPERMYWLV